ncbi:MAG: LamG domain-containing protein [Chloroflexi bacterium]|nr:LamG domain-containing protein [Chloroflexota bacterium]
MATNPGRTNLVAWWAMDEASGSRADSHTGGLTLTDNNTVAAAAGKHGNGADFESANSESLSRNDGSEFDMLTGDWTLAGWIKLESAPASNFSIFSKYLTTGEQRAILFNKNTSNVLTFTTYSLGTATPVDTLASTFGALSAGVWYFVAIYHDATNDIKGIRVNATLDTVGYAAGVFDSTFLFLFGRTGGSTNYFDGVMDEMCLWNKVLSADELDWLYNGGTGRTYAETLASGTPIKVQLGLGMMG